MSYHSINLNNYWTMVTDNFHHIPEWGLSNRDMCLSCATLVLISCTQHNIKVFHLKSAVHLSYKIRLAGTLFFSSFCIGYSRNLANSILKKGVWKSLNLWHYGTTAVNTFWCSSKRMNMVWSATAWRMCWFKSVLKGRWKNIIRYLTNFINTT